VIYIGKRNIEGVNVYIYRVTEIQTGREGFRSYSEVNTLRLLQNTRNLHLYIYIYIYIYIYVYIDYMYI